MSRSIPEKLLLLAYLPVLGSMILSLLGVFYFLIQFKGHTGWPYLFNDLPVPHPLFMLTFFCMTSLGLAKAFEVISGRLKIIREKEITT